MVSYSYTNRLRSALSLDQPQGGAWTQAYGYDSAKRLASLSSGPGAFAYSYHGGLNGVTAPSDLVKKVLFPTGSYVTNHLDPMGRLTNTWLKTSTHAVRNFHFYDHNAAGQSTRQTRADSSYVDYTYDGIGQLKTAKGVDQESSTANRPHEQFGYAYDAAGNLNLRTNNLLVQTFTANGLNQLTNATRSGTLTVAGAYTGSPTNVNVDGFAAILYEDRTFAVTNRTLTDGTNTWDAQALDGLGRQALDSVSAFLPASVDYVYDLNGNMLTDGRRHFRYDDENQLIEVILTNATRSVFVYDGKMRRRQRTEYAWQNADWRVTGEVRYVY